MPIGGIPLGSGIIAGGIEGSTLAGTHPFRSLLYRLVLRVDPKTKRQQLITGGEAYYDVVATTNAAPVVVSISGSHNLETGDQVFLTGCDVEDINNTTALRSYTITKVGSSSFSLDGTTAPGSAGTTGTIYPALVGAVDGEIFTAARLLAIYNEARFALFLAIRSALGREAAMAELGDVTVKQTALAFGAGVAAKPAGYVFGISLTDTDNVPISILPYDSMERVRNAQGSEARVVFDVGTNFVSDEGADVVPDASTYKIRYIAIADFIMEDLFDDSVAETFNPRWHPLLLDIAQMLCNEQGSMSVVSWASQFIRRG